MLEWNDLDLSFLDESSSKQLSLCSSLVKIVSQSIKEPFHVLEIREECIVHQTGLSLLEAKTLITTVAKSILPLNNAHIRQNNTWSLGDSVMNQIFGGGLPRLGITEISGISAVGKTQIALHLSLAAQLPKSANGLFGSVIYICTEDAFPFQRLYQMIPSFVQKHSYAFENDNLGERVFVRHVSDVHGIHHLLDYHVPTLITQKDDLPVRLLILDSAAACYRSEQFSVVQRMESITKLGQQLKFLSEKFRLAVVVINQVTDWFPRTTTAKIPYNIEVLMNGNTQYTSIPSLGLAWYYYVDTRIMVKRLSGNLRWFEVISSNYYKDKVQGRFRIDQDGIHGITDV
jgi:RecA/RadA recombinase